MKFWVLGLVMCVLLSFSASASTVTITTPDSHSQTIVSGSWANSYTWAFDKNYSSSTTCTSTSCTDHIFVNFTNTTLINNSNNVILMLKDGKGTVNVSITSACSNNSDNFIGLDIGSFVDGANNPSSTWNCWNGTSFINLRSTGNGAGYSNIYDYTLFFNYTAPVIPVPTIQDQTFSFLGAYAAIGIGLILFWTLLAAGKKKRVM